MISVLTGGRVAAVAAGLPFPKGDPEGLRDAARRIGVAGSAVSTTGHMVGWAAAGATSWQGEAASSFRGAVGDVQSEMAGGAGSLERAAGALGKLATGIEDAQGEVGDLAVKVQEAEEAADQAQSRAALLDVASAGAATALDLFGADPPRGLVDAKEGAEDAAGAAQGSASRAREHAADVRRRAVERARELCEDCERQDRVTATVVEDAAGAAPTGLGAAGMPGARFSSGVAQRMSVSDFKELAFLRAGIDPTKWNPEKGLDANDESARAVYAYYEKLGLEDNGFQWMKMAAIGGPLFYAGFKDIDGISGYFEEKFLTIQKAIFSDLAWQHEAFMLGGAAAIQGAVRKLPVSERRAVMDSRTMEAWKGIESGDPYRVEAGNLELIRREQGPVIQRYYDDMQENSSLLVGQLSDNADTPMPGSETFNDYDGDGNIADYEDRFDWIQHSVWPAHLELVYEPGAVEGILAKDFDSEVDGYRQLTPEGIGKGFLEDAKDSAESLVPDGDGFGPPGLP